MKRKLLAMVCAAAMITSMGASVYADEEVKATGDEKIALITMDSIDQHWITLNEGAQAEAEELGVTVDFMSPNTKDDAQQIECVNNAVAGGYDAIMVAANGPDAISSALQEAKDQDVVWKDLPPQDDFLESMAEAASAVVDHFAGKIVYINVMANMSVDCDCCAVAEDPCLKDMGILISTDPVAIDRACIDLVKKSADPGRDHFMERVTSRNGEHTIDTAAELGVGSTDYELIEL